VNDTVRQLHTLAQGGGEGWSDILVFAVVAVFWLIGIVAKAARKRPQETRQRGVAGRPPQPRETWQQRLTRKAQELQRAAEARARELGMQGPAPGRPAPQPGKIAVRPGRGGESVMVYEQGPSQSGPTRERHATRQRQAKEAVAAARYVAVKERPAELKVEIEGLGPAPSAQGMMAGASAPPESLEPGRQGMGPLRGSVGYEPASIIDYNDPDALRKAVLHYEILGKPLSLRDPSKQTWL
jgi:hypothetical protein